MSVGRGEGKRLSAIQRAKVPKTRCGWAGGCGWREVRDDGRCRELGMDARQATQCRDMAHDNTLCLRSALLTRQLLHQ